MGKPSMSYVMLSICEYSSISEGTPGELKHLQYPEEEKEIRFPSVAASETGRAQTNKLACRGCQDTLYGVTKDDIRRIIWKDESKKVIIL